MVYKILSSDSEITGLLISCLDRYPNDCTKYIFDDNGRDVFEIKASYLDDVIGIVSDLILSYIFKIIINSEIKQYSMLDTDDKNKVVMIMDYKKEIVKKKFVSNYRKKLKQFFNNKNIINIVGFIDFCTNEFTEEIELLLDDVVDEYLTHNEYREFILLLKYYIEVEEPKFGKLIVEADENGDYKYYDSNHRNITDKCTKNFTHEFNDESADKDDKLISTLILMLPEKIYIYGTRNIKNDNILQTLKEIFENRIQLCSNDYLVVKK